MAATIRERDRNPMEVPMSASLEQLGLIRPNTNPDVQAEQAERIGREHGASAASWVEIDSSNAAEILTGIEDGDPAVLDMFREPNLSGEYAGEYVSADLASDLDIAYGSLDADGVMAFADLEQSYLDAASETFWSAIETRCLAILETDAAEQLRRAGFPVSYASREDVTYGTLPPYSHYRSDSRSDDHKLAYVDLSSVAKGEDAHGQSSYVDRSNFRRLTEDYPEAFTPIGWTNVDGLGSFVRDIAAEDGLVDALCSLATDYPVYDDDDLSTLEQDEISEQWSDFGAHDFGRELGEDAEAIWDTLTEDEQSQLFYAACEESGYYPEAASVEILWSYAFERNAPIAARMLADRTAA
jgi:hypothetical protein